MDGSRQLDGEGEENWGTEIITHTHFPQKNNNINTIPKFYFLLVIYTFLPDPLNFLPVS